MKIALRDANARMALRNATHSVAVVARNVELLERNGIASAGRASSGTAKDAKLVS